ncbi:hypothetical protein DH2020_017941 [Rehmannia glutinosa]|uniref:Uncharacterized protein n=1 Tax=Rehmannia glutinosa TaxID=99300 RepID=A0ABR0WKY4_REHGL
MILITPLTVVMRMLLRDRLPEDVKEGQFAVHTVDDGELRKYVLQLSYLADPGFLKLLEQAEEEFGFGQTGILAIPCTYSDLQTVIGNNGQKQLQLLQKSASSSN